MERQKVIQVERKQLLIGFQSLDSGPNNHAFTGVYMASRKPHDPFRDTIDTPEKVAAICQ
jgi:hypothetical protein